MKWAQPGAEDMTQEKDTEIINSSRRTLLKLSVAGLLAGVAAPVLLHLSAALAATTNEGKNVLIVSYSRSGNTRDIANQIHGLVGGEVVELQTVEPYPDEYIAVTKQAKEELQKGFKPPLKTKIANFASYDVVFVGSPNWWNTFASPVRTFLSEYDFSGKTIAPFITHEGSGLGASAIDITKLCPNAKVLDGLAVRGKSVKSAQDEVSEWLRKLGMLQ
jgi:flavodoxin